MLDINEARKGNMSTKEIQSTSSKDVETLADLGIDVHKHYNLSKRKAMSFADAHIEFVAKCMEWCCNSLSDARKIAESYERDGALPILSYVVYTCVLSLLLEAFDYPGGYPAKDDSAFSKKGMTITLFREIYINYCLYQLINTDNEEYKAYYKMRAEQGFHHTLAEELATVDDDAVTDTPEEELYEYTKTWGLDESDQFSVVNYWKTETDMPEDLRRDLVKFMTTLRDYLQAEELYIVDSDNLIELLNNLINTYGIFNAFGIKSMITLLTILY